MWEVTTRVQSAHSRRSYEYAIERFIAWYCGEPRLGFNRSVVVRYRSFLENLSLSAATINLHLTAIRRLADEATESGWLSPELVTGIRRVKGVKRLGRKIGNWLTGNQAQELLNAVSQNTLQGRRDGAMLGLLLGCGLRRSVVVALRLDQLQLRDCHWVIADLVGKGGRIRTVPVPNWCKRLVHVWLRDSGVNWGEGVQAGFEEWSATRCWSDSQRSLVCGQTVRQACRHRQFGAPRSSSQLRAPLPRLWSRTRTDPVSAWPCLGTNDRTVHRLQAKPQRSGQ
jgi:site-specific recombinase XerC